MRSRRRRSVLTAALFGLLVAVPATADRASQRCAAAKLTAASRKASGKLGCYRRAVARGVAVDQACLAKAEQKFTKAFPAAEQRGGCLTTGDAASVEATVDQFVETLASNLPATTTTTVTTTTSSTNSTAVECSFSNGCTGSCAGGSCGVVAACTGSCVGTTFPPACVCAAVTFTTCTAPICPTTTSIP